MFLDQALFWWEASGFAPFYKSDEDWSDDLPGLSRYAIRKARERLQEMGILVVATGRHPSLPSMVTWYDIDRAALDSSFGEWAGFNSRLSEIEQLTGGSSGSAPSTVRIQTVDCPVSNGQLSGSGRSYNKEATPTASLTAAQPAAAANASAREAAAAAAPGQLASSGDDAVDSEPAAAPMPPETPMVAAFVEAMQTDVHALPDEVRRELVRHARRAVELGHRPADVPHAVTAWRRDLERGHRQTAVRPPRSGQVLDALVKWARNATAAPLFASDDSPPQPEASPPTAADGDTALATANAAPAPRRTSVGAPSTAPPIPPTAMLWPEPHLGPLLEALGYTPASCPPGERLLADRLLARHADADVVSMLSAAARVARRSSATDTRRVAELQADLFALEVAR